MDAFVAFLIDWGYWGMLVSAFLAGSILPFSSEAVMVGLIAAGLQPVPLLLYGTAGNVLGAMLNYGVGRLGRIDWIERFLHIKREKLDRAQRFLEGRGAWIAFFAFVPVIGDVFTVALGLMRSNFPITVISIAIGKFLRYALLVYGSSLIF